MRVAGCEFRVTRCRLATALGNSQQAVRKTLSFGTQNFLKEHCAKRYQQTLDPLNPIDTKFLQKKAEWISNHTFGELIRQNFP